MARVKFPGGVIAEGMPDDVTYEQALVLLKNSQPEAYTRVLNATAQTQAQALEPNVLERFGRGMTDVATGVGQLAGLIPGVDSKINVAQKALSYLPGGTEAGTVPTMTPEQAEAQEAADVALYEQGAGPGMDLARIGGQVTGLAPLAFVPGAAAASLPMRTAVGAGTGALGGAMVHADQPGERLANTLYGGVGGGLFGAAAPAIANTVGRFAQRLRGGGAAAVPLSVTVELQEAAARQGVKLADLSDASREALEARAAQAMNAGGDLDADALVRRARIEDAGFTEGAGPMRGQVTRDPGELGDMYNLEKLGRTEPEAAQVASRMDAQRARAMELLEGRRAQYGDPETVAAITPGAAGDALEAAAKEQARASQRVVSAAYKEAEKVRPDAALDLAGMRQGINDLADTWDLSTLPAGVRDRISGFMSTSDKATPRQLVNLREMATNAYGTNQALDNLLGKVTGLIDNTLEQADEFGDAYRAARQAAAQRFESIGPRTGMVGRLIDETNAFEPERLTQRLMTGGPRDAARLRDFVTQSSPEAWEQAQASVLNQIIERSTGTSGQMNPASFANALKGIGKDRLRVIFGDDGAADLLNFSEVARDLFSVPPGSQANFSGSGIFNTAAGRGLMRAVLGKIPGAELLGITPEAIGARAATTARARATAAAMNPNAPAAAAPPPPPGLLPRAAPGAGALTAGLMPGPRQYDPRRR